MKVLLIYEPYSKPWCLRRVTQYLDTCGIRYTITKHWGLRSLLDIEDSDHEILRKLIENIECISRIYVIDKVLESRDLNTLLDFAFSLVKDKFYGKELYIDVRRWDKSYPFRSVDIARELARKILSHGIAIPNPKLRKYSVLIGIEKDFVVIGYTLEEFTKEKRFIPIDIVQSVVCIVEEPQTTYEIMDLIQFSRSVRVELRFINPSRQALFHALRSLGVDRIEDIKDSRISIHSIDTVFNDLDSVVVLSPYSRYNEDDLIKFLIEKRALSDKFKIGLVVGNEFRDVSPALREKADIVVRLGPMSSMPMRSVVALAYALGIVLATLSGYIE